MSGFVLELMHCPLPWIIGPLFVTAILSIAGVPAFSFARERRIGQLIVGSHVGLRVTEDVLGQLVMWLPAMVVASFVAIAISAMLSIPFARHAGIDRKTAFFAMMPGGVAEMSNIGALVGAASAPIALSQSIRLALIVTVLPPIVILFDIHGAMGAPPTQPPLEFMTLLVVIAAALAGVWLATLVRLNNPWLIGAIAGAAALAATGMVHGRMPVPLYDIGQVLIGISIGSRFKHEFVGSMLRISVSAVLFILILSALLMGVGWLAAEATGVDLGTTTLATSAGGIAEMAITAQGLGLNVALVTGFHFVRGLMVNGFAAHFWRPFSRWSNYREPARQ